MLNHQYTTTTDAAGAADTTLTWIENEGRRLTAQGINSMRDLCHDLAAQAGWWGGHGRPDPRDNALCFSNKLCLIHSEISEAMEGDRKGLQDDKLPHREMREVELADALIRIFDLAGAYGMDIGGAMVEKLAYNATRADHKPEARAAAGGKAY